MGTIVISNLSTIKDKIAIDMANDILTGGDPEQLIRDADLFNVNISVRHDKKTDAKVVTISDRD